MKRLVVMCVVLVLGVVNVCVACPFCSKQGDHTSSEIAAQEGAIAHKQGLRAAASAAVGAQEDACQAVLDECHCFAACPLNCHATMWYCISIDDGQAGTDCVLAEEDGEGADFAIGQAEDHLAAQPVEINEAFHDYQTALLLLDSVIALYNSAEAEWACATSNACVIWYCTCDHGES